VYLVADFHVKFTSPACSTQESNQCRVSFKSPPLIFERNRSPGRLPAAGFWQAAIAIGVSGTSGSAPELRTLFPANTKLACCGVIVAELGPEQLAGADSGMDREVKDWHVLGVPVCAITVSFISSCSL
jgi:hypothetical protein